MALSTDFETQLKEIVLAKRLSGSKITKLTELALKNMEDDTNMVSILYRTHKSLSPASKVSSLYVFDALARAAKSKATKRDLSAHSPVGNSATFLAKVEAILDGLFTDMLATRNQECKEKSKKILDIWTKGRTFPEATLSRLTASLADIKQETERVSSDPRIVVAPQHASPPPPASTTTPQMSPPPPPVVMSPPPIAPVTNTNTHSNALLTLLQQVQQVNAAQGASSTTPPVGASSALTAEQLLLQQLAQVAQVQRPTPQAFSPPNVPTADFTNVTNLPRRGHHGRWESGSSMSPHPYEQPHSRDYRSNSPEAINGFNYDRRGATRDPRQNDHGGRDWNAGRSRNDRERFSSTHRRTRDSRSRSPPSRYGGRRTVKPYSPPRRPSMSALTSAESRNNTVISGDGRKDEFGRDIPPSQEGNDTPMHVQSPPSAKLTTLPPSSESMNAAVAPPQQSHPDNPSSTSSIPTIVSEQAIGLEGFVPQLFNPMLPDSWLALGKMWEVTNGYMPSQEELMQYVAMLMMGGAAMFPQGQPNGAGQQQWSQDRKSGERGRFPGRGRTTTVRAKWDQTGRLPDDGSEAVVLGGGDVLSGQADAAVHDTENNSGGSMKKLGDKWVFVKTSADS